jgi:copper(I)-binding protein
MDWLANWLRAPDQMLEDKDPIAIALYEQYNKLAMPNLRLNSEEVVDVLDYLRKETERALAEQAKDFQQELRDNVPPNPATTDVDNTAPPEDVVAVMNAWVRAAHPAAKGNSGYLTLANVGSEDITLTGVQSDAFRSVEICEMAKVDGSMKRQSLTELVIPAGGRVELKPGRLHLLLKGRQEKLVAGENIDLTLTFNSGSQQKITVHVLDH